MVQGQMAEAMRSKELVLPSGERCAEEPRQSHNVQNWGTRHPPSTISLQTPKGAQDDLKPRKRNLANPRLSRSQACGLGRSWRARARPWPKWITREGHPRDMSPGFRPSVARLDRRPSNAT